MWNHNGKIWYSEQEYKELQENYNTLENTYNACEKEYKALAKRYHELQAYTKKLEDKCNIGNGIRGL